MPIRSEIKFVSTIELRFIWFHLLGLLVELQRLVRFLPLPFELRDLLVLQGSIFLPVKWLLWLTEFLIGGYCGIYFPLIGLTEGFATDGFSIHSYLITRSGIFIRTMSTLPTRWWSESKLAPLYVLTSIKAKNWPRSINKWSFCLKVPSGKVVVFIWAAFRTNLVFLGTISYNVPSFFNLNSRSDI